MNDVVHEFPGIRRVVTGHDEAKRSVVTSDALASNHRNSNSHTKATTIWITDDAPTEYTSDRDGANIRSGFAPPTRGSRFGVLDIAPGNPHFLHKTDTVDYVICLRGTIDLELDNTVVTLNEGDIVVQRGTNHAWINRSALPARIAFVLMDAEPKRPESL